MSRVTVWLTSYQHGRLLRQAIESVLHQTFSDYELFIIDDASNDNSQEIIREYAAAYPKIQTILRDANVGHSAPFPYLPRFSGEYLAILHGDDFWMPDKLEKQVRVLDENPSAAACFTAVRLINEKGEDDTVHTSPFAETPMKREEWLRYFFDNGNCLCHSSSLVRLSTYRSFDLNLEGLSGLTDLYKWIRFAMKADLCLIPEKLTAFRMYETEKNESGDNPFTIRRHYIEEHLIYKSFFEIEDRTLLCAVFPECEEYFSQGEGSVPYALARVMSASPKAPVKLLGIEKLCELRRDPVQKERLERLYGFDNRALNQIKCRSDVFGVFRPEQFIHCSLYLNDGSGYSEETAVHATKYIPGSGRVTVQLALPESVDPKKIRSLRFDPDEGVFRRVSIRSAHWEDGKAAVLRPVNAGEDDGRTQSFFTTDPQYDLAFDQNHRILNLVLEVSALPVGKIEQYIAGLQSAGQGNRKIGRRLFHR